MVGISYKRNGRLGGSRAHQARPADAIQSSFSIIHSQFSILPGRQGFNGIVERSEIPTAFSFHKSIGKKDDDVKNGEGQHYDFGARAYDPRVGRWYKLDPKESCYPGFSPYHFAANNPIIVIDQDGEIWKLTFRDGDDSELQAAFESMIRKVFSDKVMAFPANGIVELGFVDEYTIESLSKEQQELYNVLLDVIKDEENTAVTQIVYDDDRYYVGSYQRQPGTGDGWDESIIDVADLEHYSNNDDVLFYAIAVLGHEVIESYYKATEYGVGTSRINGRPFYEWAHSDAIEIEEKIGGYERVGNSYDGTTTGPDENPKIETGTYKMVIQTGGGSSFWSFFGLDEKPVYKTIETNYKDGKIENVTIKEGDTR